jgi:hypothetical protein
MYRVEDVSSDYFCRLLVALKSPKVESRNYQEINATLQGPHLMLPKALVQHYINYCLILYRISYGRRKIHREWWIT